MFPYTVEGVEYEDETKKFSAKLRKKSQDEGLDDLSELKELKLTRT